MKIRSICSRNFRSRAMALNDVSTHPEIISFVERLLGTTDVLLSQAAIWAKYAGTGDFEQGLHLDYQGNTLVVPRDDGDYRQVNMILYYSDVRGDGANLCRVTGADARSCRLADASHAEEESGVVPLGAAGAGESGGSIDFRDADVAPGECDHRR